MALESFDPNHLTVQAGPYIIDGFAETMLTISRPNPMWNTQTGARGTVCRVKTNDRTSDVSLTLQQCSLGNDKLNAIASSDEFQSKGVFKLTIIYKPPSAEEGKVLLDCDDAYFERKPDATWGVTPQDRTWVIKCPNSTYNLGVTSDVANQNFVLADVDPGETRWSTPPGDVPDPAAPAEVTA